MFCYYDEILNNRDLFNNERARNIHNTDTHLYNCAGYALGTFSWYQPYDNLDVHDSLFSDFNTLESITQQTVSCMLKDFEGRLRIISSLKELEKNEYAIAYRVSSDGDFHFMKRQEQDGIISEAVHQLFLLNQRIMCLIAFGATVMTGQSS